MTRFRFVHLGTAALLSAGIVTTIGVAQNALAGDATPAASSWVPIVPCRLMDTRPETTVGDRDTPFTAGETATIAVVGEHGDCLIPEAATGITGNVTATHGNATSFLTVYPANADLPNASTLNWRTGNAPVANHIAVSLSPDAIELAGSINVFNHAGTVNVIIDITGYFAPADTPGGISDLGCDTGQTVTWNGETWACTNPVIDTDTLGALECQMNQAARWNGTAWECGIEPITASLVRKAGDSTAGDYLSEMFPAYSPNVNDGICWSGYCYISLVDVVDHTTCHVNITQNLPWYTVDNHIAVELFGMAPDEPLYITIACSAPTYPLSIPLP